MPQEARKLRLPPPEDPIEQGLAVLIVLLTSPDLSKVQAGARGLFSIRGCLPLLERLAARLYRLSEEQTGATRKRTLGVYKRVMEMAWEKVEEERKQSGKLNMYIEDGKVVVE